MQAQIIVESKKAVCFTTGMYESNVETPVSIRMPKSLESELSEIAKATKRSRNNAILLLLRRGIDIYKADGVLIDTRPTESRAVPPGELKMRVPFDGEAQPPKPDAKDKKGRK